MTSMGNAMKLEDDECTRLIGGCLLQQISYHCCLFNQYFISYNKTPTNWWGRQNATPLKFNTKTSVAAFSAVFFELQ